MSRFLRLVMTLLATSVGLVLAAPPVTAQDATIGGGSDLQGGAIVAVPVGTVVPPVHHVFADNPGARPIEVEFRAEAPPGIEIVPEQARMEIAPGTSAKDHFSIAVSEVAPPGDHAVTVQLVRSDVAPEPGEVTHVPGVGVSFTVRVGGEAGTVTVRALSALTGKPVDGTLRLSAITGDAAPVELAHSSGSELTARVSPGEYEATYGIEGRELAARRVDVDAGETAELVLEVKTLSFTHAGARPSEEDGKVVVAELVAALENHLRPLDGPVTIRAVVHHDGEVLDRLTVRELDSLPLGVTEAKLSYRPASGFSPGRYRVTFEVAGPDFTLRASDSPRFEAAEPGPPVSPGVLAAALGAAVVGAWALARTLRRRRRRQRRLRRAARQARLGGLPFSD